MPHREQAWVIFLKLPTVLTITLQSTNYSSTANSASTSVMGLTGSGQIDPKVSPGYPMQTQTPNAKPKMATVSFDPRVAYQNPPASNGNEYWSMNNPNAYAAQNFFGSQVSPVAPVTTMHSQVQVRNSEMSHVSRDNMSSTSQSLPYPSDISYYWPSNPTQVSWEIEHGFASLNQILLDRVWVKQIKCLLQIILGIHHITPPR